MPELYLRIFISSPGDVADERAAARQVLTCLPKEYVFRNHVHIEEVSWDDPGAPVPMDAHLTPQDAINQHRPEPSQCDIVVVILWSRMGTTLPPTIQKPDGTPYLSGTEWEFLNAMASAEQTGRPTVLVYRRLEEPQVGLDDPEHDSKTQQYKAVKAFFADFHNPDGSLRRSYMTYRTTSEFQNLLERQLRELISVRLDTVLKRVSTLGHAVEKIPFEADLRLTQFLTERAIIRPAPLGNPQTFEKLRNCIASEAKFAVEHSNCFDFRNYMQIYERLTNMQRNVLSRAILTKSASPPSARNSYFNRSSPIIVAIVPNMIGSAILFKYLAIVKDLNIIIMFENNLSATRLRQSMSNEGPEDLIVLPLTSAHSYLLKTTRFHYVPIKLLPRGTHGLVLPDSFRTARSNRFDRTTHIISLGDITGRTYFKQLAALGVFSQTQLVDEPLPIHNIYTAQLILDDGLGIATYFPFDKIIDSFGFGYRLQLDHLEVSSLETVLFAKEHLGRSESFTQELQYWISIALEAMRNTQLLELMIDTLFCDNTFLEVMATVVRTIETFEK